MLDVLAVLARRWRVVAATVIVAVVAAAVVTLQATPVYRASTQLFVALDSDVVASDLDAAASFASQRVKSYPDLVDSPLVLGPTIEELGLATTPQRLARRVSAEVPPGTVLLQVYADDASPTRAAAIADAVADNLTSVVEGLDRTDGDTASPVRVSTTRPASAPTSPRSPVPWLILSIGLLLGLLLGAVAAVVREVLDTRVRDEGDVSASTGLTVLARVPGVVEASGGRAAPGGDSLRREAVRTLRTNLGFARPDRPVHVVAVTSARAGEGRTTTAVDLAAAWARGGHRTLLVDADLRHPSAHAVLGLAARPGLSDVIAGDVGPEEAIRARDGYDVLTGGAVPPDPTELLDSGVFRGLLAQLARDYDRVVLDTPPLLAVTDGAVVAGTADAALLVVESGRTRRADLRDALLALRAVDADVTGVVLTRATVRHVHLDQASVPAHDTRAEAPQPPRSESDPTLGRGTAPAVVSTSAP